MKKLLYFALALVLVLTLAACAEKDDTTTAAPDSTGTQAPNNTPDPTGDAPHTHSYGDWTIVTAATCTEDGVKERVCACGEKETEPIAATGHGETEIRGKVDATCTTDGYSGDTHCTVCGDKIESGGVIPATGHDYQDGVCSACREKEPIPSEGLEYELNPDGESYRVTDIGTCTDTDIIIPSTYEGKPVTGIIDGVFEFRELTSIVIPKSITSMRGALAGCIGLMRITVADGNPVYHVDGNCVIETASKTLIAGCNTSVVPTDGSVTSIDGYAFAYCTNLKSITIPDGVTSIGRATFFKCESLQSVVIPDSVTSIGYEAFYGCSSLTSIEIPKMVTDIDNHAFEDCENLATIVISDGVTSIGFEAFYGTAYYDDPTNWADGVLYIGNHLLEASQSVCGAYTIREGTKSIAGQAFYDCSDLISITFPESLTSIGYSAFSGCGLTSITIPAGVVDIGIDAFSGCKATSITVADGNPVYHSDGNCLIETASKTLVVGCVTSEIPTDGSVTSIGDGAFSGCGLMSIEIPDSVTSIGDGAFSGCGLMSIEIPDSVTSIGDAAFSGCYRLAYITIPESVMSIGEHAFFDTAYYNNDDHWEGGILYIGNRLLEVKSWVLSEAYRIKVGTKYISDSAFAECIWLTSLEIPESVTRIGAYAFAWCTDLTSITFNGTKSQWNAIEKVDNWDHYVGNYTVYCTDGKISK